MTRRIEAFKESEAKWNIHFTFCIEHFAFAKFCYSLRILSKRMEYKFLIISLLVFVIEFQYCSSLIKQKCESLSFRTGVDLQCDHPITKEPLDCENEHVPIGTIAKYKCEDFFVSSDGEKEGGEMRCSENGKWMPDRKFRSFSCNMECGKSYEESGNTKWPWHVGIYARESRQTPATFKFACGGTLINPFNAELLILTSTECLRNRNPDDIEIRMGLSANFKNKIRNNGDIFSAKKIMIDEDGLLALIQLSRQPLPGKNILPACLNLNFNFAKSQLRADAVGQLVGFGDERNGGTTLRNVGLEVVPIGKCIDSRSRIISKHSFCAGSEHGTHICEGDFGGGLFLPSYFANSERHFLHGVLGDGVRSCKNYAWFTGLSEYADWIEKTALTLHDESSIQEPVRHHHVHLIPDLDSRRNEVKEIIRPQDFARLPTFTEKSRLPTFTEKSRLPTFTEKSRLPTFTEKARFPTFTEKSRLPNFTGKPRLPTFTPVSRLSPFVKEQAHHHVSSLTNTRFMKDYEAAALESHNLFRKRHGVPPVKLSQELSIDAQVEAQASLITNRFKFEGFTNWYGISRGNLPWRQLVEEAVSDWYKTSSSFNWNSPVALPFTQIVWKRTTEIGVGVAQRGSKQVVVVKYNRPLVISSESQRSFHENVLRPVKT